jgi:hypothetical protein
MAESSHGALLQIGDGATPTEAFTTIAEVKDFTEPTSTPAKHDTTSHSTTGKSRTFRLGLQENGEVTFEVNETNHATHGTLRDLKASQASRNFQMMDPEGDYGCGFAAYVADYVRSHPVDGIRTGSVTLFVTGAITDIEPES